MGHKPTDDKTAITDILEGMVKKGWTIDYVDDEEDTYHTSDVATAVSHVTDVDQASVYLSHKKRGIEEAWLWFVLGNDPEEVVCNYTVTLDPDLSSIVDPWWD